MSDSNKYQVEQLSWTVDGRKVAGQGFGPPDGVRVLALHGWLDNSDSFRVLAANLPKLRIIALDLPGHGLSEHRSQDASYQIWDDLPQIIGVLDALGWEQCVMLGHSRGAMISTLLAATMPERVKALITLDGLIPYPFENEKMITQLRTYLKDRHKTAAKPKRVFKSHEDFVSRRARLGEPQHIAEQLANRNLRETDKGFEWRGDHRLSGSSAVKFNQAQCETTLKALTMPVLNIWAGDDSKLKKFMDMAKSLGGEHIADLTTAEIAGHHHMHMEEGPASEIAHEIDGFYWRWAR
jgi:pimeloyl-ACP methyl ester carboxylesterase